MFQLHFQGKGGHSESSHQMLVTFYNGFACFVSSLQPQWNQEEVILFAQNSSSSFQVGSKALPNPRASSPYPKLCRTGIPQVCFHRSLKYVPLRWRDRGIDRSNQRQDIWILPVLVLFFFCASPRQCLSVSQPDRRHWEHWHYCPTYCVLSTPHCSMVTSLPKDIAPYTLSLH